MALTLTEKPDARYQSAEPHAPRWTKAQYHQMGDMGWFAGKRVELVEGEIVEMAAMNHPHWVAINLVSAKLRAIFEPDYLVITQLPIDAGPRSEPEPDVAVVPGTPRDYLHEHPAKVLLAVEVSDSTLQFDRTRKVNLYAAAGIEEYWILNLNERQLEVYRQPTPHGYSSFLTVAELENIAPLNSPDTVVTVAESLP